MTGVPRVSNKQLSSSIGAYEIEQLSDPQLFLTTPIVPTNCPRATHPHNPLTPLFLVDSGATHIVLSKTYASSTDLDRYATNTHQTISGFDGSKSTAGQEIQLWIDTDKQPPTFIITRLKNTYDGILGMPWMKTHGHCVDWRAHALNTNPLAIATTDGVPLVLTTPSTIGAGPRRQARMTNGGVCVIRALTLLQCKLAFPTNSTTPKIAGKQDCLVNLRQTAHSTKDDNHQATQEEPVATSRLVLSLPKNPSNGQEPWRHARNNDKGVCALSTLALLQRNFNTLDPPTHLEMAGKQDPPVILSPHRHQAEPCTTRQSPAPTGVGSSVPQITSLEGKEPRRNTRNLDEGVCAYSALTLPQHDSASPPLHHNQSIVNG
jgi:hypothetical protein